MASETLFLRAILPSLPNDLAKKVRTLCSSTTDSSAEYILDTLIRFISGGECVSPNATTDVRAQWDEKQHEATKILNGMVPKILDAKRAREDDSDAEPKTSKRAKPSTEDAAPPPDPLFTIHSVSVTSPVRKKVDITIHKTALILSHTTTHVVEANIPLSTLTRAFLLPTRGKQKAHWTIVLLSSDTLSRGKPAASNPQVIFGVDAIASSPLPLSTYNGTTPVASAIVKGSPTRSSLLDFLSRLGVPLLEPTPDVFKSACNGITSGVSASEGGIPGVEAFRGAKPGNLYFTREGILYGESKPCEFWALEDFVGKNDGIRVIGGVGRTCSVVLTRKSDEEGGVGEEGEEDVGVETEFSMVDSKERPGIEAWVRTHRNLFGKKKVVSVSGAKTLAHIEDDSDDEDEDFEVDSDVNLDGSESSSGESSDEEGGEDEGGSENDAEESGDEDPEGSGEEEELDEKHHPLLRQGAMPRMNRAMVEVVAGMVENDILGGNDDAVGDEEELEEDELDD